MSSKSYNWDGFSDKERLYCYEYLVDSHKTNAAIRAGFAKNSAQQQATRVHKKCKTRIEEMISDITLTHVVSKDRIVQELALIGLADLKEAFNEDGSLKTFVNMPSNIRRAISSIDVQEVVNDGNMQVSIKKVRFHDKIRSLELLGRNLQMFTQKLEIDNKRPMVVVKDMTGRKK